MYWLFSCCRPPFWLARNVAFAFAFCQRVASSPVLSFPCFPLLSLLGLFGVPPRKRLDSGLCLPAELLVPSTRNVCFLSLLLLLWFPSGVGEAGDDWHPVACHLPLTVSVLPRGRGAVAGAGEQKTQVSLLSVCRFVLVVMYSKNFFCETVWESQV